MRYPLIVPGLEGDRVEVQTAGLVSPTKVLLNGNPAPPGSKRGEFQIPRPNTSTATVQILSGFLDHVPRVTVDGVPQMLAPPLNLAEKTLTVLPILLVFSGGLIGGVCGGIAVTANMAIFRSAWPAAARYAAALGILLAALLLDLALLRVVWPYIHPAGPTAPYGATQFRPVASFPSPPPMPSPPMPSPPMPGFPGNPR